MAKGKSFIDKLGKSGKDFSKHCSKCGESISTVKVITSELVDETGAWRFKKKFVGICKCNEEKIIK